MEITKNQITDILIAMVQIVKSCDEIDGAFGTEVMIKKFGRELDTLADLVLDFCGVPKEETPFAALGIDTNGWNKEIVKYGFCRDNILENAEFEHVDDLEGLCEAFVIHLLEEWLPDEEYIVEE